MKAMTGGRGKVCVCEKANSTHCLSTLAKNKISLWWVYAVLEQEKGTCNGKIINHHRRVNHHWVKALWMKVK